MKITVDATYLDEKAVAWWKAKTPAMRGVLMQAVYELETSAPSAPSKHLIGDGCETHEVGSALAAYQGRDVLHAHQTTIT